LYGNIVSSNVQGKYRSRVEEMGREQRGVLTSAAGLSGLAEIDNNANEIDKLLEKIGVDLGNGDEAPGWSYGVLHFC
jgi:hypothetical protein